MPCCWCCAKNLSLPKATRPPSSHKPPPPPPTTTTLLVSPQTGPDSNKLPTSHTCFNTLLLPEYASAGKMADMLKLAVMNSEGFGLE